MGRLFVYLAIVSFALGLFVLMPGGGNGSEPADALRNSGNFFATVLPVGGGWIVGLTMGIAIAWVTRLDWRSIPMRVALFVRTMRHRIWWMVCGGLCASVLLFF